MSARRLSSAPTRAARFVVAVVSTAVTFVLVAAPSAHATLTNVAAATDICSASADPCVLTQPAEVVDGAVLDFGTRGFEIRSSGRLDVNSSVVTLRAGSVTLVTTGTAISIVGPSPSGSQGGALRMEVMRRCAGNTSVRCLTDAECASAGAGTCSSGSGAVSLGGKVIGNADYPGAFIVAAAGPITITQTVQMNGTSTEADGGLIDLEGDSVTVSAILSADGGGQGSGGDLSITAVGDLTISSSLDLTGGDFDGGSVDLSAGRDLTVTNDVNTSATSGGGFGGDISMDAGRDLRIDGGTSSNRVIISADGHESVDLFGGDGGSHDYSAGRDLSFGQFTQLTSDGAPPDGYGDFLSFSADGNVLVDGDISARGRGTQGGGGELDFDARGQVTVSPLSQIIMTGGSGGGGTMFAFPDGDMTFQGSFDGSAGSGGVAGDVAFEIGADTSISGSVKLVGAITPGVHGFSADACRIQLDSTALISTTAGKGRNTFVARERMTALAGSRVSADATTGANTITYRSSAKAPVLAGTFSPVATLKLDTSLVGCPVCGNKEIDAGETCDDGNHVGGDGCSADCQDEGCIASTPGYPSVPLCDDGDACSLDSCDNVTHTCVHAHSCDDGVDCTADACVDGACVHTANDTACNSGTPCAVGFCNATTGCVFAPVAGRCDDGLFCNGADECADGSCSVHGGDPCTGFPECRDMCDESADRCQSPAGTPCSGDGRVCTDDFCNGVGTCIHPDLSGPCDDGIFCNGPDFCTAGSCSIHAGDPCLNQGVCQSTCNETADRCTSDPGIPCADDGNFCTDDTCDGQGGCSHVPYAAFAGITASVVRKGGPDNDRFALKTALPLAGFTAAPNVSGLRFLIVDDTGATVFSSTVPAASFADVKGDGSLYRFRDKTGTLAGASGVYVAVLRRNPSRGIVAVRLKGRNYDVPGIVNQPQVSAALGFGTEPGSPCFAGVALACTARGSRVSCGN